mmetsp:Transcript_14891/g.41144  ORF Transcript_14891/g.41144 Transcript_14891/m.41144 type:complete len:706 (-) Transcript_14891:285-2402(-)
MGNSSSAAAAPSAMDQELPGAEKVVNVDEAALEDPSSKGFLASAGGKISEFFQPGQSYQPVSKDQQLATEEKALKRSLAVLQFHVMANAINTKMLNPNFAIMCSPGADPDSFDDTDPFDFNSATYFLPLCSLLGVAIASIFTGTWSDKYGRKRIIQISTIGGTAGSIAMYFARDSFWGFSLVSFLAGLFRGTLPVAMAYIGDVFTSNKEKSDRLGVVVGCFVLGNAGGGIFAILMGDSGLFTPLLLGAGFMALSYVLSDWYLIEPGDARITPIGKNILQEEEDDEEKDDRPDSLDGGLLWHIISGAFADNVGSTALFPLCLSPLALEQYHLDFVEDGEDPVMTITAYQWLSVCVALMVIPGTLITPAVFDRVGAAGGCVFGNIATGLLTMALLFIGNGKATTGMFAFFIIVMYLGFPLTVVSQLSTGPMLDRIAPEDKVGYVQGLNNTVMNLGMAVSPWIFGLLADYIGTNPAIWIGIGISFLAGAVNWPLMHRPGLGPPGKAIPEEHLPLEGEDVEFVERVLSGENVDPARLHAVNLARAKAGHKALMPGIRSYEEDKEDLASLRSHAKGTFQFRKEFQDGILNRLKDPETEEKLPEICKAINHAFFHADPEDIERADENIGKWFAAYLRHNGFNAQTQPTVVKQMIMLAFPPILEDEELTPENIQAAFLKARRVTGNYMDIERKRENSYTDLMGNGTAPTWFS